jgi:transcriptional regulator with XRE-family HTH domain
MRLMEPARAGSQPGIDHVHGRPCSHGVVPADPPVVATTEKFRADMYEARNRLGLSQEQLGAAVGTSQNMISLIESGKVLTSPYILPICKRLRIAAPFHGTEEEQAWLELGLLLSTKYPAVFRSATALIESMLKDQPADDDEAVPPQSARRSPPK